MTFNLHAALPAFNQSLKPWLAESAGPSKLGKSGLSRPQMPDLGALTNALADKLAVKTRQGLPTGPTGPGGSVVLDQQSLLSQRMSLATANYRLDIRTADGRSASLSFDYAAFSFEQSYTRQTLVGHGKSEGASRLNAAREMLAQHGQAAFLGESSHQKVDASAFSLSVSGDVGLLKDYFAAAPTAQRIFDFASNLGQGIAKDDPGFARFSQAITAGIGQGFAAAQAALGGLLAPVSHDTRTLLDAMLAHFGATGERSQASDYLDLLKPKE